MTLESSTKLLSLNRIASLIVLRADPHVTWTIPYHGGDAEPFAEAVQVTGGKDGSWCRSVVFSYSNDGFELTTLDMYRTLQPRRNGENGQPLPLNVKFRFIAKMDRGPTYFSSEEAFHIMQVAKLSVSSDFEVELVYRHMLESDNLAAELSKIKEQLIEIARKQGCKLV